jgi:hypothetical protein
MSRLLRASLVLLVVGCGGGASPTDPNTPPPPAPLPGGGSASAQVNGQAFAPITTASATHAFSGGYNISLNRVQGLDARAININLMNIVGTGTYPLGTGAGVSGGLGIYAEAGGGWGTPLSGDAGTITLSTLTDTRIAGTFSFTADVLSTGATGVRTITGGAFDLPLTTTGTFAPVPERNRSTLRGTIGGEAYNASTIVSAGPINNILVVSVSNTKYSLSFAFNGLTAPGTYPVSSIPGVLSSVSVSGPPGGPGNGPHCCWSSALSGATGSVVVSSYTSARLQGTFSFTLPSSGIGSGPATLSATGGTFDIGLQ